LSSRFLGLALLSFLFNAPSSTEIYTLSLHDALPICPHECSALHDVPSPSHSTHLPGRTCKARASPKLAAARGQDQTWPMSSGLRSEEHTSELQSLTNIVCRLLLEKKKNPPPPPPSSV